ncbi:MAG: hypothetical protein IPJ34_41775 [Myxococcales bacterium]|nr:hypothetical protein [Myxococcales bacterium]
MRKSGRVILVLVAPWMGGCAYDMDHLVAIEDGSVDVGSGDSGADTRADTAVDTGPRPDGAGCGSLGTTECLKCCLDAAPRATSVLDDKAGSCLCQDSACKSACSKEFCKPPSHTIESKACAACVSANCKDRLDEAKKSDSSVTVYLACAAGC